MAPSIQPRFRFIFVLIARRFLWIAAFAFWMGGFSFYGGVVIAVGAKVVAGGESEFGFVTQQVTYWLNVSGCVALTIFLVDLLADWRVLPRWGRWGLMGIWMALAMIQISLICIHPAMDRLLNPENFSISQRPHFRHLHMAYLILSTFEWGGSLLFLTGTVWTWSDPHLHFV